MSNCLSLTRTQQEYYGSLCAATGAYGLAGAALGIASPITAALYGLTSILSTRLILPVYNQWRAPTNLTQRIIYFAAAFFSGTICGAVITNGLGFSIGAVTCILLHATVLSVVFLVIFVSIPCLLCMGTAIGVRLLPE